MNTHLAERFVMEKHCPINRLEGVASTGCASGVYKDLAKVARVICENPRKKRARDHLRGELLVPQRDHGIDARRQPRGQVLIVPTLEIVITHNSVSTVPLTLLGPDARIFARRFSL